MFVVYTSCLPSRNLQTSEKTFKNYCNTKKDLLNTVRDVYGTVRSLNNTEFALY